MGTRYSGSDLIAASGQSRPVRRNQISWEPSKKREAISSGQAESLLTDGTENLAMLAIVAKDAQGVRA